MAKRSVIVVVLFIGLVSIWMGGCQTQEQKVERLITELGHKETKVRANAAEALGQMGEGAKDAASTLIQLLQDQDQDVRYFAARALGRIGAKDAVPALIPLLQDQNAKVRRLVAYTLGMIGEGEKDAVPALIPLLQDQNRDVRGNAAWALGMIGEGAKDAVPALIQALQDQNRDVRDSAARALEKIKKFLPEATDDDDFDF